MRFPGLFFQQPITEEHWRNKNHFVSASCNICQQSPEFPNAVKETAPRKNHGKRRLKVRLMYTGDGKELNNCVGVVGSSCFRCHVKNLWEWNTSRGKSHSMIRFPWETDDYESGTRHERTTEEAAQNWQNYSKKLQSLVRDYTQRSETVPTKKTTFRIESKS